ncbi:hypothetical protein [Streptomyces sp. rh34]|uniref:hypothetical protein n=1 Tax=Streptomyces sp. rh34 TaxID=2034272 RepID=UPI0015CF601A|nr:hypothetical protein [Streptomyces sp. rh34]
MTGPDWSGPTDPTGPVHDPTGPTGPTGPVSDSTDAFSSVPDPVGSGIPAGDPASAGRGSDLAHDEEERAVEQALALVGGSNRRPSLRGDAPGGGLSSGPDSNSGDSTEAPPETTTASEDRPGSPVRSSAPPPPLPPAPPLSWDRARAVAARAGPVSYTHL